MKTLTTWQQTLPHIFSTREPDQTADTQRARVLDALIRAGRVGLTDIEIQRVTNLPGDTERPRRVELVNMRRVEDSGTTRRTPSGKLATVWVATEYC